MKLSRPAALALAALGLVLMIAGPLLPGGERLSRESPPEVGHVTDMAMADDGALLVGTQDGELWRRAGGVWSRVAVDLRGAPVTALAADTAGDPARGPIGTAAGLVNGPAGLPPVTVRVSDDAATRAGLVLGTGDGVLVAGDGAWRRAATGINVYRLEPQTTDGTDWLHLGAIGAGVWSARVDALTDWAPNSDGLHPDANVFTFVTTAAGRLIAGTDRGLYWQAAPRSLWQPLKVGLETTRILALHLDAPASDGSERLWLGTDRGLYRVAVRETIGKTADETASETRAAPAALAYATAIEAPEDMVRYGISWIWPDGDGVLFSAGSVYRYGPAGLAGWYWVSLGGLVLLLLGGWLLPAREAATADA